MSFEERLICEDETLRIGTFLNKLQYFWIKMAKIGKREDFVLFKHWFDKKCCLI